MNILITGGTGLLGRALTKSLLADGNKIWVLTRSPERAVLPLGCTAVGWDGRTAQGWGELVNEMDAIVNLAGVNTASWPWTEARKQSFWNSRVWAGQAVADAIRLAKKKPKALVQMSGIGYYGMRGEPATESTPPAEDFSARLTVAWEFSSQPVEDFGVRRIIIRTAVVLARDNIIMKLLELPARLFFGGRLGNGQQTLPWIHIADVVDVIRFLLNNERARGPYNLIAPESTINADFLRALTKRLNRPYWFHVPAFLMRLVLGEMGNMVLEGRPVQPKRLVEAGYQFNYPTLSSALEELYR
ncbi:MAG: TIGR01777 family protein [Anaerolineaceae bacterium]|nr:MAG: TIGR01777 family protein [Anaerolineaceae bacterium]